MSLLSLKCERTLFRQPGGPPAITLLQWIARTPTPLTQFIAPILRRPDKQITRKFWHNSFPRESMYSPTSQQEKYNRETSVLEEAMRTGLLSGLLQAHDVRNIFRALVICFWV